MQRKNRENYEPPCTQNNIYFAPYKQPTLKTTSDVVNGTQITYTDIPIPERDVFANRDIPVGGPHDPPSSWNNELTRGGNIAFRKYGGPPSWINDLDRGGNPTTGEHRKFGEYGGNPITRIKPVVVPQIYDLEHWQDNNLITFSQINTTGIQEDMYLSGYAESTCCDYLPEGTEMIPKTCGTPSKEMYKGPQGPQGPQRGPPTPNAADVAWQDRQRYSDRSTIMPDPRPGVAGYCQGRGIASPSPVQDALFVPTSQENYSHQSWNRDDGTDGRSAEEFAQPVQRGPPTPNAADVAWQDRQRYSDRSTIMPDSRPGVAGYCQGREIVSPFPVQDTLSVPYIKEGYEPRLPGNMKVMPNQSGMVNAECGYNPEQIFRSGLPSNYPAGNCEQDPALKQYNENLYTQIVTPGVYTRSQVNEPINSNIGISFQQQFEPTTVTRDENGLHYLLHDPRVIDTTPVKPMREDVRANYDNVYDPRFSGYGTSYRSYLEPITGQTRFMYDDVNAIRMPNYVTRSNIDHLPYADTYGPIQEGSEMGNVHNPHIRYLAQDSWMRDSIGFRDDMTQLLMRKINSQQWQKRQAPLGPRGLVRRAGT
jgi:hypothetical protein